MHAYLIIAHEQLVLLKKLIEALDDSCNDIYIFYDGKEKGIENNLQGAAIDSKLYFVKGRRMVWGAFSQINCELELLTAATSQKRYQYFHLLSGVDFPLKSQKEIHDFFEQNNGKEFVHIEDTEYPQYDKEKIDCYYPFQEFIGKEKKSFLYKFQRLLIHIEKVCRVDRHKKDSVKFYKGSNWISITNDFALYILSRKEFINKMYRYSLCGDESFVQTLLMDSPYKDNLYVKNINNDYKMCMRYIDWKRGQPYIFRNEDYDELIHSDMLFARKFNYDLYPEVVDRLLEYVKGDQR